MTKKKYIYIETNDWGNIIGLIFLFLVFVGLWVLSWTELFSAIKGIPMEGASSTISFIFVNFSFFIIYKLYVYVKEHPEDFKKRTKYKVVD